MKHKVRRKRKPHQPDGDSDEETVPKVTATKTGSHSDDEVKRTSQDSGVGEGAAANPVDEAVNAKPPGLFGADAAVLGVRYAARASREQALFHYLPPCPPWLLWRR